jgi:hypothetical protein
MSTVSSTFIIRLWAAANPLAGEPPRGHGRIDHVQSGQSVYFDQLDDALAFVRRHFGAYESLESSATAPSITLDVATEDHRQPPDRC